MTPRSWKTTTAGVLAIVAALGQAGSAIFSGHAPDWTAIGAQVAIGVGLIAAADHSVATK